MIALILAMSTDRAIGKDNRLPWGMIKTDMTLFRSTTMGSTLIMGRKTFESLNGRSLSGRKMVVISSSALKNTQGALVVRSIPEALSVSKGDVFFIGGVSIYIEAEPYCDTAYVTNIPLKVEADTHMPEEFLSEEDWDIESKTYLYDEGTGLNLEFVKMTKSSNIQKQAFKDFIVRDSTS